MIEIQSNSDYEYQEFDQINLQQNLISHADFQSCTFHRCDLSQSVLSQCRFDDCIFQACDLSLVKLKGSSFRNSSFSGSKLIGIDWTEVSKTFSVDFQDCVMNLSNFSGLNLKKRKIVNCMAHEVSFADSNMTECTCTTTDFTGSIFSKTNLTKADFSHARNYAIDVKNNTITKMKLSLPEALSLLEVLGIIIAEK
jgi:fluoroquinolone resistance protein